MADKNKMDVAGADPSLPFYVTADLFLDGSIDMNSEGKDPLSLETALEYAKESVEEHGGTIFVIECRAIRKITRRSPRVETIKTKAQRHVSDR